MHCKQTEYTKTSLGVVILAHALRLCGALNFCFVKFCTLLLATLYRVSGPGMWGAPVK